MNERNQAMTRSIVRRELHSSRAVPAALAALLIFLVCCYVMLEAALKATGEQAWLLGPDQAASWLGNLPNSANRPMLAAAGALLFLIGLVFFLSSVLPGRRARLVIPNRRAAVVVDAEALASSLARCARIAAGVAPEQILVTVGRRRVEVQVRPTSGIPADRERIQAAVEEELVRSSIDPAPEVRVDIAPSGVIGQ